MTEYMCDFKDPRVKVTLDYCNNVCQHKPTDKPCSWLSRVVNARGTGRQ